MATDSNHGAKARILVLSPVDAPELKVLERLPAGATILGVGRTLEDLKKSVSPSLHVHAYLAHSPPLPALCMQLLLECAHRCECLPCTMCSWHTMQKQTVQVCLVQTRFICAAMADDDWSAVNVLLNCGSPVKRNLEIIWPHLPNLEWLHSSAAGVEHILFPALVDGPVTLTNAKVSSPSA